MTKKQKKLLRRILLAVTLMAALHFLPVNGLLRLGLYLIPYGIVGHDILRKAVRGIWNRQVFDENFLMSIATVGALVLGIIGEGDYTEAVAVMLFYQIGELFQSYAVGKSRRNIQQLMDIRPDYANLSRDGIQERVPPEIVEIGSLIVVQPGEKVPIDGVVLEGCSSLNTAALTGESLPREIRPGDEILSGCINLEGALTVRTTKEFSESTASKILELVESASARKSKTEKFIAKFARVYTPGVCIGALILAVLPPLAQMLLGDGGNWGIWLYRALTFLVVSCPCALVISIPLTYFAGIGGASHQGILIKGANYLEALAKTGVVVFDKTGTLTCGSFAVQEIYAPEWDKAKLLELAAWADSASSHPISLSIQRAYGGEIQRSRVKDIREISGQGVIAMVDGMQVAVGNQRLMQTQNLTCTSCEQAGTAVHIGIDGKYAGYILICDRIKPNAKAAVERLQKMGVEEIVMLTGDNQRIAQQVATEVGISTFHSQLLPEDKVSQVEAFLQNKPAGKQFAFVGDGINDAPVLARVDIGIAMGAMGSDAAIEAADVVLMDDNPMGVPRAIGIARKCMAIVWQNTVFAIAVKMGCLVLTVLGITNMWLAIFADVGVMVLAVLNAIRALWVKKI